MHRLVALAMVVVRFEDVPVLEMQSGDDVLAVRQRHDPGLRRPDQGLHDRRQVEVAEIALKLFLRLFLGEVFQDAHEPVRENDGELAREPEVVRHEIVEQRAVDDQELCLLRNAHVGTALGVGQKSHFAEAVAAAEIGERRPIHRVDDLDDSGLDDEEAVAGSPFVHDELARAVLRGLRLGHDGADDRLGHVLEQCRFTEEADVVELSEIISGHVVQYPNWRPFPKKPWKGIGVYRAGGCNVKAHKGFGQTADADAKMSYRHAETAVQSIVRHLSLRCHVARASDRRHPFQYQSVTHEVNLARRHSCRRSSPPMFTAP